MIGSAYFAGYSLSCLIVPRLADLYGRRLPYLVSSWFQFFVYIAIYFSKSSLMTTALILVFGFCGAGRSGVGYLYLLELVPATWKSLVGTLVHSINSFTFVWSAYYFWYLSKDWQWLLIYSLSANFITAMAALFIPESPLYLYSAKDFDKTRESLTMIAKFNGSNSEQFSDKECLFEAEYSEIEHKI
jgi:MFS family permease